MSIEKFEVGKKYRFLKDGDGDRMYCGVDAKAGQEFTVSTIIDVCVNTCDVNYLSNSDNSQWTVHMGNDTYCSTTLEDFEEVVEVPEEGVDFERYLCEGEGPNTEEENIFFDLIKEVTKLQQEYNILLMFHRDGVVVSFENSDTEYQISSQEELTTLIEASKVMKRFERKESQYEGN